ncbi:AAA family ATPase [Candidatus Thiothrix anitrata]|uniref:AAA family ATPase n=1 Tax=Candidatus Thiothrix anitrata TaxID=2823902 RepID=A0ABX7WZH9_9GAMM|nr:ATP-binding protein [Candidatus Thiothrix anitrata]QTR49069.1 AAA family ATPase [Candidatus Thiothrix anitrata]
MLDSLHIKNFRCFEDLTIPSLGRVNLIVGKNNSGKTTLLEAVSVFANGKDLSDGSELAQGDWAKVIDKLQSILTNRNEIFGQDEDHSDFGVFIKSKNNEKDQKILFETKSQEEKLEIAVKQDTQKNIYLSIASKQGEENLLLNKKGNIHRYWEDSEHIENLINKKNIKRNNEHYDDLSFTPDQIKQLQESFVFATRGYEILNKKVRFIPSTSAGENIAELWDAIYEENKDGEIYSVLKLIIPNISSIYFLEKSKDVGRIGYLKEIEDLKAKPIRSMGEGISRLIQIFLHAFLSRGGCLLLDEFENGLHYSIQEEVWEKLFKLAKELDIQVFATTHSEDTVKAFSKVALRSPEEGQIIYLARHMREQDPDKGKISAIVYNENDLEMILQTGMEVR